MKPYTVLIVDDHVGVAEGLRCLLDAQQDLRVIGSDTTGKEGLKSARELKPDIILMDLHLPDMTGIDAAKKIREILPSTFLIIYTGFSSREYVLEAMKAGVNGFVAKEASVETLIEAIRSAVRGDFPLILPPFMESDIGFYQNLLEKGNGDRFNLLTAREKEIFQLIAKGHTNQQIARHLHLSPKTVDSHRTNLMRKLEIHSVGELIKLAIKKNMIAY